MIYTLDTDTLTFLLKGDERVNDNADDATTSFPFTSRAFFAFCWLYPKMRIF